MSACPSLSPETPQRGTVFGEEGSRTSITRAGTGSWRRMELFLAPVPPGRRIRGTWLYGMGGGGLQSPEGQDGATSGCSPGLPPAPRSLEPVGTSFDSDPDTLRPPGLTPPGPQHSAGAVTTHAPTAPARRRLTVKGPDARRPATFAAHLFLMVPSRKAARRLSHPAEPRGVSRPFISVDLNRPSCLTCPHVSTPPSGSHGSSWMVAATPQPPSGARLPSAAGCPTGPSDPPCWPCGSSA